MVLWDEPLVTVFGNGSFEEVIKVKRGHVGGPWFNMTGVHMSIPRKDHMRYGKKWPSASPGQSP